MGEDEKGGTRCCWNCKWHEQYSWVCCNGDSDHRADFTDDEFVCEQWEVKA